jgi:hypothetical protein
VDQGQLHQLAEQAVLDGMLAAVDQAGAQLLYFMALIQVQLLLMLLVVQAAEVMLVALQVVMVVLELLESCHSKNENTINRKFNASSFSKYS